MADPLDRLPWVTGPAAVGSLLAGLSWPVAMRALPLERVGRVLGLLVAAQTVSVGAWSVVSAFTPLIDPELPVPKLWWVAGELLAVALVLVMMFELGGAGTRFLPLVPGVVALVGATSFGMLRWMAELLTFGGTLGDGEPEAGAGLGFAATLLLCGGALLVWSHVLSSPGQGRLAAVRHARREP